MVMYESSKRLEKTFMLSTGKKKFQENMKRCTSRCDTSEIKHHISNRQFISSKRLSRINPIPDMPILGFSIPAANKDMISKI